MSRYQRALCFGVRTWVVVVHVHQAEPLRVAVGPLEVVQQRPGEVAAHVRAPLPRRRHRGDVRGQVRRAVRVGHVAGRVRLVVERRAVLGDHHRHARVVLRQPHQQVGEPLRHDLPVHRRDRPSHRHGLGHRVPVRVLGAAGGVHTGQQVARVVVHPEHVDGLTDDREVAVDHRQLHPARRQVVDDVTRVLPAQQGIQVDPRAQPVRPARRLLVGHRPGGRHRPAHVQRDAQLDRRPRRGPHPLRGQAVAEQQVVHGVHGVGEVLPPRRLAPLVVAEHRRAPRLVQRRPRAHPVLQRVEHVHRVVREPVGRVAGGPATGVLELLGQVPVVQRHPRVHARAEQFVHQPVVEREAGGVDRPAPARLHPRPGHREPVGVHAQRLDQRDIGRHPVVVVARQVTVVAAVHHARRPAVGVPDGRCAPVLGGRPLDLVRRGRHAPPEVRGQALDQLELLRGFHHSGSRRVQDPSSCVDSLPVRS